MNLDNPSGAETTDHIDRHALWPSRERLELAVLDYVHGYNTARLHSALGYLPPHELERLHFRRQANPTCAA